MTAPPVHLSVIVPVLNEAAGISALLGELSRLRAEGCEVLIADGGSQDGGAEQAERAGFPVLHAPTGRARQMNHGAAAARGEALLFLHADTRLPPGAVVSVTQALQAPGAVWGRFDVRIDGRHPMLRVIGAMMNWRSRVSGIATGDQAIFVTRAAFERVGGYPDQPLMEDIELSRRLRALASPVCLRTPVVTSGRRWETRGVWRTMLLMWRLRWAYWRGAPAEELAQRYR